MKLIKNGLIIDGSGSAGYKADVLIDNDRIVKIGDINAADDMEVIDAKGLV